MNEPYDGLLKDVAEGLKAMVYAVQTLNDGRIKNYDCINELKNGQVRTELKLGELERQLDKEIASLKCHVDEIKCVLNDIRRSLFEGGMSTRIAVLENDMMDQKSYAVKFLEREQELDKRRTETRASLFGSMAALLTAIATAIVTWFKGS